MRAQISTDNTAFVFSALLTGTWRVGAGAEGFAAAADVDEAFAGRSTLFLAMLDPPRAEGDDDALAGGGGACFPSSLSDTSSASHVE